MSMETEETFKKNLVGLSRCEYMGRHEDAQDRDQWRLKIGANQIIWKMAIERGVCACVCSSSHREKKQYQAPNGK